MTLEQAIGRAVLLAAQQRQRVFVVYRVPQVGPVAYVVRGEDVEPAPMWTVHGRAYYREGGIEWRTA
jgi:hypothetical protein